MQITTCRTGLFGACTHCQAQLCTGPQGQPSAEPKRGAAGIWLCLLLCYVRVPRAPTCLHDTEHESVLVQGERNHIHKVKDPVVHPDQASNQSRVLDKTFCFSEPICLLTSELSAALMGTSISGRTSGPCNQSRQQQQEEEEEKEEEQGHGKDKKKRKKEVWFGQTEYFLPKKDQKSKRVYESHTHTHLGQLFSQCGPTLQHQHYYN